MYKCKVDAHGNILLQFFTGDMTIEHDTRDDEGFLWLETGQALDLETSYWNGTAWATKTSRPTAYHVWESGGWVESEDLKDVIRGHIVLQIKQYREYLLVQCDWTQLPDSPLTDEKKAEWATYRQVLRDYPANNVGATDFDALTWPTLPS
jgi:hypothetical protein